MTDQSHPEMPVGGPVNADQNSSSPAVGRVPINAATDIPVGLGEPKPVTELTPDEQMALFEKELKEKDWGHQPC